ncbi:hypothetical protein M9H77_26361 [Catharanthus roseus]|uniref:Uncharacterized protein n=1 Tax=Catharanthus roseus TaxID=4058 RepID=A0ACC0A9H4_CATRO|nr:hypothetical protein M9H77_26361 [Catharanthus roseus]
MLLMLNSTAASSKFSSGFSSLLASPATPAINLWVPGSWIRVWWKGKKETIPSPEAYSVARQIVPIKLRLAPRTDSTKLKAGKYVYPTQEIPYRALTTYRIFGNSQSPSENEIPSRKKKHNENGKEYQNKQENPSWGATGDAKIINVISNKPIKGGCKRNQDEDDAPFVVTLDINSYTVHRILVHTRSTTNVLFKDAFGRQEKLNLAKHLDRIHGRSVTSIYTITLPINVYCGGTFVLQRNCGATPTINTFKAFVSTYFATVEIRTKDGPHVIRGDKHIGRECFIEAEVENHVLKLSEYHIDFPPRKTKQAQVLADFVMENTLLSPLDAGSAPKTLDLKRAWILHVEGSTGQKHKGAGPTHNLMGFKSCVRSHHRPLRETEDNWMVAIRNYIINGSLPGWEPEARKIITTTARTTPKKAIGETPFNMCFNLEALVPAEVGCSSTTNSIFNSKNNDQLLRKIYFLSIASERGGMKR